MFAILFPAINPEIISVGPVSIKWYSLAYIFGILFGWYYALKLIKKFDLPITAANIENLVTWVIIGIIVGGRLGYVLFYDPVKYLLHPLDILKTYQGGMSFHGGLIGLVVATYFFSKKHKIQYLILCDLMASVASIGIFLGRIANFINAELYGRITNVPWGVIFPDETEPRHPSQLYEAFCEGILIFIIINILSFKFGSIKRPGLNTGIFLVLYSIFRIIIENFREPDIHIGFIWSSVTLGQILSVPLLIAGIVLIAAKKPQN